MKYIPRELAFAKLKALVDGATIARHELTGGIRGPNRRQYQTYGNAAGSRIVWETGLSP